ncbi:hypothetical protein FHS19_006262 [Paenibacillus rhizosphaerae]|uniref:Uncharacterized protein n=1 Tax=Paenibacillus rhizosphaerae TaxID=297318 RepID=A0A839U259_9BACL|nr:hypothetical protein [Paenibacillus rhizosphaerae]MBB3131539.1 hypothetical protein [Paenibacillus rhizosphaerae]
MEPLRVHLPAVVDAPGGVRVIRSFKIVKQQRIRCDQHEAGQRLAAFVVLDDTQLHIRGDLSDESLALDVEPFGLLDPGCRLLGEASLRMLDQQKLVSGKSVLLCQNDACVGIRRSDRGGEAEQIAFIMVEIVPALSAGLMLREADTGQLARRDNRLSKLLPGR